MVRYLLSSLLLLLDMVGIFFSYLCGVSSSSFSLAILMLLIFICRGGAGSVFDLILGYEKFSSFDPLLFITLLIWLNFWRRPIISLVFLYSSRSLRWFKSPVFCIILWASLGFYSSIILDLLTLIIWWLWCNEVDLICFELVLSLLYFSFEF